MLDETQDTLSATFLDVVEQLTFMFGELTAKTDLPVAGQEFTSAKMTFNGDLCGSLEVVVPTRITADIAANILGLEPEDIDSGTMTADALAEMLNVVCGHVIMGIVGTGANFQLDVPRTEVLDQETCQEMVADEDFIGFVLDDDPVFLGLKLEN